MGKCLDILPPSFALPALAAVLLLLLIVRRLFHHAAERRRTERELLRYSNLHLLTTTLSASGDLKQLVERTLEGILQALEVAQGCALLHLPGPDELNYSAARGFSSRALGRLGGSPLREYLSSCGERWGSLMVFPDLLRSELMAAQGRHPLFQEFWEVFTAEGTRTLVVAALETQQRSCGTLIVASRKVRRFRPGELRLILGIGRQISVALGNCSLQKTAERHEEELRILHRVGEALSATFDLERQLQILQRELKGLLGVVNFSLAFQESLEGRPETVFAFEQSAQAARSHAAADGPAEYVLRTRAPLLITHDFINATRRLGISPVDPAVRTWCGVPIHFSDGSAAVLTVADFEREGALDERRFHLLQILADEAAVAIENARLFQREQRRARHLALLNEIGRKAAAVLDPRELLTNFCQQLRAAFGYELARVQTLDRERGELVVEAEEGYGATFLGHRFKLGEGLAGVAAESGEPVLANDVEQDERYTPLHPSVRASLSLPLIYRKETLGVLTVESLREHCFSAQDVLTLRALADQLAIALHNAWAYQVAQEQAITDSLTGLKTHRYFMEAMEAEWRRSPRSGRPFSLIMMDLDGFKQVNDRYGHLEGDKVLIAVARILEARSRQSNVVARYGGDEFAILMPEAGTEQAEILGERLCASFTADPYLASRGVTASLGIATFPVHGATPDEILRVADSGMYLAKHDQGNRVRVASNPSESASADWEQQLLQAYLGVAVKRMFSTGPEVFNQYRARFEAATQDAEGQNVPLMETVTALAFAIDAKDHYTKGHSQTVANLAAQIAQQVGLSGAELEEIRLAGILHDIGKIGIPESVLNKPARLTPEEFQVMKGHTALGDNILAPLKAKAIEHIRQLVRHHHERFDGCGYPDGLKGDEIPLGARILSIADCFDTIVSERAYKKAGSLTEAVEELRRCRGSQFDGILVDAFLTTLKAAEDASQRAAFVDRVN
jgi:diguanylate cyclase (GGDEF)-like protein/putative nucleotidyltransferase with HDIG domain